MATTRALLKILDDFSESAEGTGHTLRLDFADLILLQLRKKGWTQKKLAEAAQMKESFISRIIHGNSNCTFDMAGRILFAMNVKARLVEETRNSGTRWSARPVVTGSSILFRINETTYGSEKTATIAKGTEACGRTIAAVKWNDADVPRYVAKAL